MADIRAFHGLRYNPNRVHVPGEVIAPPYDVISPELREDLIRYSPWNVVRLILPDGPDPYAGAAGTLRSWIDEQILVRDEKPALYCYHQTFVTPEGEEKTRKGFMARIRIEDFDKGIVLPHEATLFAPKEDRLKLLRATSTNFSPIFGLYSDPDHTIDSLLEPATARKPDMAAADHTGVANSLWVVTDPLIIHSVEHTMKDHWVLIADGHHRYESCLVHRNEMRQRNSDPDAPFNFTLMYFTNIHHPGITVLPYNRGIFHLPGFDSSVILKKARKYFEIHEFEEERQAHTALKQAGNSTTAFLALVQDQKDYFLFKLHNGAAVDEFYPPGVSSLSRKLDVNILHRLFIHHILGISEEDVRNQTFLRYYKDPREEKKDFDSGRLQIAFFLNPTPVEQVVELSRAGETMPQKSTYFHPKLMTGLVMNPH